LRRVLMGDALMMVSMVADPSQTSSEKSKQPQKTNCPSEGDVGSCQQASWISPKGSFDTGAVTRPRHDRQPEDSAGKRNWTVGY